MAGRWIMKLWFRAATSFRAARTMAASCFCASAMRLPRETFMPRSMTASDMPCAFERAWPNVGLKAQTQQDTANIGEKSMAFFKSNGDRVPQVIHRMADEVRGGRMDRREFLALASAMGATTAFAYGMIGL